MHQPSTLSERAAGAPESTLSNGVEHDVHSEPTSTASPASPVSPLTPAWRRVGADVTGAATAHEALAAAGLDWSVQARPLAIAGSSDRIAGHKAIVRSDTGDVLGVVGSRYQPIQNLEAFAWADRVVGSGGASFESAGVMGGGKLVWMLLRLAGELRVGSTDDVTRPYVLVVNAHDGSRSLLVLRTAVRLVCSNTLLAVLREAKRRTLALRHTSGSLDRLDEARQVLGLAAREFDRMRLAMTAMAAVRFAEADARGFFAGLLPPREGEGADPLLESLMVAWHDPRQQMPGIAGTLWAAVNAVTQYADWERPARGEGAEREQRRLRSMWLGPGAALKAKAWNAAERLIA